MRSQTPAVRITAFLLTVAAAYCAVVLIALLGTLQHVFAVIELTPERCDPLFEALLGHAGLLTVAGFGALAVRRQARIYTWAPKMMTSVLLLTLLVSADRIMNIIVPPPRPDQTLFDLHPARGWMHRPNTAVFLGDTLVRTNEMGLRIEEQPTTAAAPLTTAAAQRILFVGDSVTMGYYHPAQYSYGMQTVKILNERSPETRWSAINAGLCGYDTRQEFHWFTHEGRAIRADLLVLQFCLNDVCAQFDPRYGRDQQRHLEFAWAAPPDSWSGLARTVKILTMRWRFGADLRATAEQIEQFALAEMLESPQTEKVQRAWRITLQQLSLFVQECRERNLPLVLLCFPVRSQLRTDRPPTQPQETLAKFAAENGMPFLDILPVYQVAYGSGVPAMDALFSDETHPSIRGHRLAAEALAKLLESQGLVTSRQ